MKEEMGLDHFQGRSWLGWHHHGTLVLVAYAFLMQERQKRILARREESTKPTRKFPTIPQVPLGLQVAEALRILKASDELSSAKKRRNMLAYLCQMFGLAVEVRAGEYRSLTLEELLRRLGIRS
jgi:hypothetical protein